MMTCPDDVTRRVALYHSLPPRDTMRCASGVGWAVGVRYGLLWSTVGWCELVWAAAGYCGLLWADVSWCGLLCTAVGCCTCGLLWATVHEGCYEVVSCEAVICCDSLCWAVGALRVPSLRRAYEGRGHLVIHKLFNELSMDCSYISFS